jgi:hypothetical protein
MKLNNKKREEIFKKYKVIGETVQYLSQIAESEKELTQQEIDDNKRLSDVVAQDIQCLHESILLFLEK